MRSKPLNDIPPEPDVPGRERQRRELWGRAWGSLKTGGLLLLCGLIYAAFYRAGVRLGCPIYALTGLYCPSCGVSRMCMHLLAGQWRAAFFCNPALFCLLPALALLLVRTELSYWRTGRRTLGRRQQAFIWCAVAGLVLFGILRNLPPFAALRPAG